MRWRRTTLIDTGFGRTKPTDRRRVFGRTKPTAPFQIFWQNEPTSGEIPDISKAYGHRRQK
jgi:hypothetical protein